MVVEEITKGDNPHMVVDEVTKGDNPRMIIEEITKGDKEEIGLTLEVGEAEITKQKVKP